MLYTITEIFESLNDLLDDNCFIENNRVSKRDFSRKRVLDFKTVFFCICSSQKRSLHTELTSFLVNASGRVPAFSPQAFSKARYKIKPEAFYTAFRYSAEKSSARKDLKTLHGYRIFAVDGTTLLLPDTTENREIFGSCGNSEKSYAAASASIFYDVLNDIIMDAVIGKRFASERQDCIQMIKRSNNLSFTGDQKLILMDRGYPSREMFLLLEKLGYKYIIRLQNTVPDTVKNMKGCDNVIVDGRNKSIKKRIIKIILSSGETEYLATNLFDSKFTIQDFYDLYHLRWNIETKYLDIKHKAELEKFTGYRPNGIRQDFFTCLFLLNLSALLKKESERRKNQKSGTKWNYQISISAVINLVRENMVKLLYNTKQRIYILDKIADALKNKRSAIRPGRHCERKKPRVVNRYFLNHK